MRKCVEGGEFHESDVIRQSAYIDAGYRIKVLISVK